MVRAITFTWRPVAVQMTVVVVFPAQCEINMRLSTSVEDATSMPPLLLDLHQLFEVFNVLVLFWLDCDVGHDMSPAFSRLSALMYLPPL